MINNVMNLAIGLTVAMVIVGAVLGTAANSYFNNVAMLKGQTGNGVNATNVSVWMTTLLTIVPIGFCIGLIYAFLGRKH